MDHIKKGPDEQGLAKGNQIPGGHLDDSFRVTLESLKNSRQMVSNKPEEHPYFFVYLVCYILLLCVVD